MSRFSECFFLIFGQLAVGGALGLAVPDFRRIERGFYKSSAGIFVGFGAIFLLARLRLAVRAGGLSSAGVLELLAWTAFLVAFGTYLVALWGEDGRRRARAFGATVVLGVVSLGASAISYRPPELLAVPWPLYAIPFLTGALMLGGVATGMLLGHWYLIDLGLSIEPLERLHRFFVRSTALHLAALVLVPVAIWLSSTAGADAVTQLVREQRPLLATRLLLGPIPTLVVAWMIHRTLRIPQTMAATGLFYIAILFATVGEMLGRLVLYRSGLPL